MLRGILEKKRIIQTIKVTDKRRDGSDAKSIRGKEFSGGAAEEWREGDGSQEVVFSIWARRHQR